MYEHFYPPKDKSVFTNREYYLKLLELHRDYLEQNREEHLAFIGWRRIGKTLILKEFIDRCLKMKGRVFPVYIDFKRVGLSPEIFSKQYIGNILFWIIEKGDGKLDNYYDLLHQLNMVRVKCKMNLGSSNLLKFNEIS